MNIDGAVTCFAPFHNVNCPKGFLYFNKKVYYWQVALCIMHVLIINVLLDFVCLLYLQYLL